jgi:SAM-dependent methyltransferase
MLIQWLISPTHPEHFDHHIDLFYQWIHLRSSFWLERGVFGSLVLKGGDVLELACGDGFNTRNFYSLHSKNIIAVDFDPSAIKTAIRKNSAQNIKYLLADIRTDMPKGNFENIIWDAAIEHFTPNEIELIMINIKSRISHDGILSGYSIVERNDGLKSLSHHEYEFKNKKDLLQFFSGHFKNVIVFETLYPQRHNLYFWASDSILPFQKDWPNFITL